MTGVGWPWCWPCSSLTEPGKRTRMCGGRSLLMEIGRVCGADLGYSSKDSVCCVMEGRSGSRFLRKVELRGVSRS